MKKILFAVAIIFSSIAVKHADAQVRFSVGVNIGSQPEWGPTGYDRAQYYYMPDIDTYYDVPSHQYIYNENNVWVHRAYLPQRYANYDRYHGYKVVVNQRNPWNRGDYYRNHYAQYRGRHDQPIIRESQDNRYRNHWHGDDNGNRGDHHDNGNRDDHHDHGDHGDHGHDH